MAKINTSGNDTSLKQLFQGLVVEGIEFLQGTVIATGPLKIQIAGDEKLIINERITIVPWHLTDYTTKATLTKDAGSLDSQTFQDGSHGGHTGGDGSHINRLNTFTLTRGTLTVYNALKVGEKVHLLALNHGKKYYVLDRVAS